MQVNSFSLGKHENKVFFFSLPYFIAQVWKSSHYCVNSHFNWVFFFKITLIANRMVGTHLAYIFFLVRTGTKSKR